MPESRKRKTAHGLTKVEIPRNHLENKVPTCKIVGRFTVFKERPEVLARKMLKALPLPPSKFCQWKQRPDSQTTTTGGFPKAPDLNPGK